MKKLLLFVPGLLLTLFFTAEAFARCGYYAPPIGYHCFPDQPGQTNPVKKGGEDVGKPESGSGCHQLDLTISCAGSGSAVDWINTCSLDCGDGTRYDAIAVQKDATTLSCWHRSVPLNSSCRVTVGSGLDSKVVGSVQTKGSCKQFLRAQCAW